MDEREPEPVSSGTEGEAGSQPVVDVIDANIRAQGDKIRELKAAKSAKDVIEPEVKTLLALKAEFKVKS